MRFAFVDAEKASHRISTLCRVMGISRAGYYQWRNRPPSQRELDDQSLLVAIEAVFKRSKCRYGSPRVHREPRSSGVRVGLNRVARLMCKNGLAVKPHKGFRCTTVRDLSHPVAPNLLARDFSAAAPGEKWVSDVTEFTTGEGTLYLAPVIDLFNREVVGHACSARNDQKLTTSALRAAIDTHGAPEGLIHHSDRGSTYTGGGFREALSSNGIVCSMSRK
ncbi:MAG: IS3 family transposase, partial [Gammaproteobacteria bacterium]